MCAYKKLSVFNQLNCNSTNLRLRVAGVIRNIGIRRKLGLDYGGGGW